MPTKTVQNCKLSVLITFCNQKACIERALNSILEQKTNYPYEILIGLDGIDDGIFDLLKEYSNRCENINVFIPEEGKENLTAIEKAALNRVRLIKEAKGEYFCVLDGDDFYTNNNRFQKLINILEENKEYIGCGSDYSIFDEKTQKITKRNCINCKEQTFTIKDYLKKKIHISSNLFIFRNIFFSKFPQDFNQSFFNDSMLTHYMLKYGSLHIIPETMMAYTQSKNSIFSSAAYENRLLMRLIYAEAIIKAFPQYRKLLAQKYGKLIIKCAFKQFKDEKYYNFAKKENCYFAKNFLSFDTQSSAEKTNVTADAIKFALTGEYPDDKETVGVLYFDGCTNFGDILNLYILNRLFGINMYKTKAKRASLVATGSLLDSFLLSKYNPLELFNTKAPAQIWGAGFIAEKGTRKNRYFKLNRNLIAHAVRGHYSKAYIEELTGKKISPVLGDPGLLASELIDVSKIAKTHKVGVILHYVDENEEAVNNIKLNGYKLINVRNNPIIVLKEIAQCEFILSSAMHGLIAGDSLGIPNKWIQLSDKIFGNNFKFHDYYSVFGIKDAKPIDLRKETVEDSDIEKFKDEYFSKMFPQSVEKIKKDLAACFPF